MPMALCILSPDTSEDGSPSHWHHAPLCLHTICSLIPSNHPTKLATLVFIFRCGEKSILITNHTSVNRELLLKLGTEFESATVEFSCEVTMEPDSEQEVGSSGVGAGR